jgi:hypothetical protein
MKKVTATERHTVLGARQLPSVKGGAVPIIIVPTQPVPFDPQPQPWMPLEPEPNPW